MATKTFKTIDEQIEILRSRGLSIDDLEKAKDFLHQNNYYRVSGYSLTLRTNDIFHKNATFQNIIDIYEFDHELRHILLQYLEQIEVTVKSLYAHEFTRIYGPTGHLVSTNYTNTDKHKAICDKARKQIVKSYQHEAYIKHYIDDLCEVPPLWVWVEVLTISDISILYSISDPLIQESVAVKMGFDKKSGIKLLGRFMHGMTILRNICAHGGRLYNRIFHQKPSLNKTEKNKLRKFPDGTVDNERLYGFLLIMKRLLQDRAFSTMKTQIIELTKRYPYVRMSYYGFREDWQIEM